ncbi:TetR family transcriptional regulator [Kutzneria sp. NPDC052558]|uniref:TetR family transcriptional regulator n=1 Tax=Kutzneria sp. NPDC052558 TaxID=3364121 RepID=UPI0037CC2827
MTKLCGLRERKKQQTRMALVDAALALFETKGFEAATVEEIAAAVDVSPRTFFRYFPAKEAVLLAVHDEEFARLMAAVDTAPTLAEAVVAAIDGDHDRFRRVQELLARTPALHATFLHRSVEQEHELVARLLPPDADPEQTLRTRLLVAATFAALRVAVEDWLATPGADCAARVRDALALVAVTG